MFRAWEIRTSRVEKPILSEADIPKIYFRHVEKIMLYLAKHVIQWIILVTVKYYLILSTKGKKWIGKNLPKISNFFRESTKKISEYQNPFFHRAVLESKIKIKRIREKVKKEHGETNDITSV